MTEKLYYKDAKIKKFDAVVLSCEENKGKFAVILDKTAFFPEGGGQPSDTGLLNGVRIENVQENGDAIVHYACEPIAAGTTVSGEIDWDKRFRFMQNHSGEHIVSGIIHSMTGFNNVGFHLGSEDVTLDLDGVMTREQLNVVERTANQAIYDNIHINAEFPDGQTLKTLEYRSKLDLTENVRIVSIGKYDKCACCAPHVDYTGEIGIIKLLDFESYKGGIRIHMLSGSDAVADYNRKYANVAAISASLSAKQNETAAAVARIMNELIEEKRLVGEWKKEYLQLKASLLTPAQENMCIFESKCDMNDLRFLVNNAVSICRGICAAFSGSDENGYQYVMASNSEDLRKQAKDINAALNGKGGGSGMIQGSVKCTRQQIEDYFKVNQ